MGTESGTPSPHKEQEAGSAEGKAHVTGSQSASGLRLRAALGERGPGLARKQVFSGPGILFQP